MKCWVRQLHNGTTVSSMESTEHWCLQQCLQWNQWNNGVFYKVVPFPGTTVTGRAVPILEHLMWMVHNVVLTITTDLDQSILMWMVHYAVLTIY